MGEEIAFLQRNAPIHQLPFTIHLSSMSPLRTCPSGHRFNKTSDCPTCPQCEAAKAPKASWLSAFSAPARRALEHAGITTVKKLGQRTQQEVMALHGMGPASLPTLQAALKAVGLAFKSAERKTLKKTIATDPITAYYAALPKAQYDALQKLRKQILAAAPDAEEHFGYGMPAFKFNAHPVLYIGAARNHCALYGSVPPGFKEALQGFTMSKGAVQFKPEKPIPPEVIKGIVRAKVAEIELRWPKKVAKSARKTGKGTARK